MLGEAGKISDEKRDVLLVGYGERSLIALLSHIAEREMSSNPELKRK